MTGPPVQLGGFFAPCERVRSKQCSRSRISGIPACGDAVNLLRLRAAAIDPVSASACPKRVQPPLFIRVRVWLSDTMARLAT